jgi:hypothetical protein
MRREPKPYAPNGWAFEFDKDTIKAIPQVNELQRKISVAVTELTREIAKAENTLMLKSLTDKALNDLIRLCRNELKQRKAPQEKFRKAFPKGVDLKSSQETKDAPLPAGQEQKE